MLVSIENLFFFCLDGLFLLICNFFFSFRNLRNFFWNIEKFIRQFYLFLQHCDYLLDFQVQALRTLILFFFGIYSWDFDCRLVFVSVIDSVVIIFSLRVNWCSVVLVASLLLDVIVMFVAFGITTYFPLVVHSLNKRSCSNIWPSLNFSVLGYLCSMDKISIFQIFTKCNEKIRKM